MPCYNGEISLRCRADYIFPLLKTHPFHSEQKAKSLQCLETLHSLALHCLPDPIPSSPYSLYSSHTDLLLFLKPTGTPPPYPWGFSVVSFCWQNSPKYPCALLFCFLQCLLECHLLIDSLPEHTIKTAALIVHFLHLQ